MTKKFKLPKWVWVSLIIVLLIGLYFAENIKGQVRFMQYCWKEGGLKVYEPLERNVGWEAEDFYRAKQSAIIDGVGFVRFFDEKKEEYIDVVHIGGSVQRDSSFSIAPADLNKPITYKWVSGLDYVAGELRLNRLYDEVKSKESHKLLVRYNSFSYSQFDPNNSFGPSRVSCHRDDPPGGVGISGWRKAIESAFKK